MYTKPVGEIIKRYNIKYQCYTDDTQVYMTLKPCDKWHDISSSIEACIADISTWTRKLRIFASSYINSSLSGRNLGLILDNTPGMEKQVNFICEPCYYQIRNIGLIRKYINDDTCKTLVQVVIIYRLDYDNALLCNIPLSLTNRLQRMHNCAAPLVTHTQGNI